MLLSGGIDSPVAAWYAMKRGMQPIYVHIHSFQNADEAMKGKIPVLIKTLSGFHPRYSAYFVPSHIFQAASMGLGKYELVMMKTFFLRLAEQVALKEGAHAIFTGESLGQVASQTAENIEAEQFGLKVPVLRPLIGYDKEEIIKVARAIGTYDQSITQYRDVCSMNAKNPVTNSNMATTGNLKGDGHERRGEQVAEKGKLGRDLLRPDIARISEVKRFIYLYFQAIRNGFFFLRPTRVLLRGTASRPRWR